MTCATHGDIARRLWRMLVENGDVPDTSPQPSFTTADQVKFINHVVTVRDKARTDKWDGTKQKRKYMVEAFRKLKPELLSKLRKKFESDFNYFGYDSNPEDFFS